MAAGFETAMAEENVTFKNISVKHVPSVLMRNRDSLIKA